MCFKRQEIMDTFHIYKSLLFLAQPVGYLFGAQPILAGVPFRALGAGLPYLVQLRAPEVAHHSIVTHHQGFIGSPFLGRRGIQNCL